MVFIIACWEKVDFIVMELTRGITSVKLIKGMIVWDNLTGKLQLLCPMRHYKPLAIGISRDSNTCTKQTKIHLSAP